MNRSLHELRFLASKYFCAGLARFARLAFARISESIAVELKVQKWGKLMRWGRDSVTVSPLRWRLSLRYKHRQITEPGPMRAPLRSSLVFGVLRFAESKRPVFPSDFEQINDDILGPDAWRLAEQFHDAPVECPLLPGLASKA